MMEPSEHFWILSVNSPNTCRVRLARAFMFLGILFLFTGCAGLQPGYDPPSVSITSFKAVPQDGIVPRFEIGLHIVNPNRTPLSLKGAAYSIILEGHKILTGATSDLPEVPAYGERSLTLNASVDVLSSIGFFADLARNPERSTFSYQLNTKLDVGAMYRVIRIVKEGEIALFQNR